MIIYRFRVANGGGGVFISRDRSTQLCFTAVQNIVLCAHGGGGGGFGGHRESSPILFATFPRRAFRRPAGRIEYESRRPYTNVYPY